MDGLTTTAAARRLHVTRQHLAELLKSGKLAGEQLEDGRWIVSSRSVSEYQAADSGRGRRWSADTSWALLAELDSHSTNRLTESTAARVRARIRNTDSEVLARKVASRTTTRTYAADDRRKTAAEMILTGRSAAEQLGTDLVRQDRIVEGYLAYAREGVDAFARRHLLIPDLDGDVVIFDRPDFVRFDGDVAGDAVVAADLARSADTRERSAGVAALEGMRQRWLAAHTK